MRIELPSGRPWGAMAMAGTTVAGGERFSGILVVKSAYRLAGPAGSVREMAEHEDAGRHALVLADEGMTYVAEGQADTDDDGDIDGDDEPVDIEVLDVTRESDIAPEKARTDIAVLGWLGTDEGAVTVAGDIWIARSPGILPVRDLGRNLFGFHPRTEAGRMLAEDTDPWDPETDSLPVPLPAHYTAAFQNFYRRSAGFSTPGNRNLAGLPAGAVVAVHQAEDASDDGYAFRLPALSLSARYRVWCGHGPDLPRHWRIGQIGALRADTLIVDPGNDTAEILWRAAWPWAAEDPATYRSIQILEDT
ncbi:hypothetical protein [Mangrovicoccus ximenensis]|uniref:hypothetical protein n=1 Tax=Mangrovicoccus ximenensis TaxID=1911570 RepID=UPI000D33EF9A|nr:hypothetical protein [Mangrovicoccus ximenensis]